MSSYYYRWEPADATACKPPKGALEGGCDASGNAVFVGRATFSGVPTAARIIPSLGTCLVSHDGTEHAVQKFEYLTGKEKHFEWRPACDGNVVAGAVETGRLGPEQLFVGRAAYKGAMCIGKIHPSHKCLYVSHEGKDVPLESYEVLVWKKIGDSSEDHEKVKNKKKKKKRSKCKLSLSISSDSDSDCSIS